MMQPPSMAAGVSRPLQLDQWANTKAPLTTVQRVSVNRLAEWLHKNSPEYKQQQPHDPLPSDPTTAQNSDAPAIQLENAGVSAPILPDARTPLNTAQDFLAWYTSLTDSVSSSTHSAHVKALRHISQTTASADTLLAQLEQCQVNVSELRAGTAFVHDSSRGLRQEAQTLLDSQLHLDHLSDEIASRLSFFTLLPYATSLLSSPDSSIVYTQEFLDLMDQLEVTLAFLQQDPARTYRDAALYRMRYAQCVTRAATLAKLAVVRDLRAEGDALSMRIKELDADPNAAKGKGRQHDPHDSAPVSAQTASAVYDQAPLVAKLRPLVYELEKRAAGDAATAAEFDSLLLECKLAYFSHRRPALARLILSAVTEIETQAASQPDAQYTATEELARAGSSLLSWFCDKETELYHRFFAPPAGSSDPRLRSYLAELAEALVGRLRLRVVKETDLAVLARVHGALTTSVQASTPGADLLYPMLQETQSRLVARAHALLASDVGGFTPRPGGDDLDFPRRIEAAAPSAQLSPAAATGRKGHHNRGKSGAGLLDAALASSAPSGSRPSLAAPTDKVALFTLPPAVAATYYAPVTTLLTLLYHLQTQVPAKIFHEVASAGVQACMTAVGRGADLLAKQHGKEDGWLFEVRQLEILREVVVSADLVLRQAREQPPSARVPAQAHTGGALVDLSSLVAAINSLWTSTGGRLLYPNDASDAPASEIAAHVLSMEQSASGVDTRLQQTLQALADTWASAIDFPLKVLLVPGTASVPQSKWQSTYEALLTCIESVGGEKAAKISTWIEDVEVRSLLVERVVAHVAQQYAEFSALQPADSRAEAIDAAQLSASIRTALLPPSSSSPAA